LGIASTRSKYRFQLVLAAAFLGVILGATGLWYESASLDDRTFVTLSREAVTAHLLYAGRGDQTPDVATERERVSARLSALLGAEVKAPDLSVLGLRLVEWRGHPPPPGAAAPLRYPRGRWPRAPCAFQRR